MAEYTRLSDDDLNQILNNYDMGDLIRISVLKGGQANSSFTVETDKGKYILTICDEKNTREIHTLTGILSYLESKSFPASRLIRTEKGSGYIMLSDKPVYVKQYLDGEMVKELDSNMLKQVGQAMAKLHDTPVIKQMSDSFPFGLDAFEQTLESGFQHPYLLWLKEKKQFLEISINYSVKRGFINGDIFRDNLLFSNGNLVAVLDFEDACRYYPLFDIGMCIIGCCSKNGIIDYNKISELIQGYQSCTALNNQERKQLKNFIEYAAVAASFWRFRQYNIKNPDEKKKDSYLELSSLADQIHEMSISSFIELTFKYD